MDNDDLISQMHSSGFLKDKRITEAFTKIDRKDFVGIENMPFIYEDRPLPIGKRQTISQPSTVAFMLERLMPKLGDKVLDVGSGSGWTTALLSYLVGPTGEVFGIERIAELVEFGNKNLNKYKVKNASIRRAGKTFGAFALAPFDKILVSAASETVPVELIDQLKAGGRLVIPVKNSIEVISKEADGSINHESHPGFAFVPLV